jgi:hypothetical protein
MSPPTAKIDAFQDMPKGCRISVLLERLHPSSHYALSGYYPRHSMRLAGVDKSEELTPLSKIQSYVFNYIKAIVSL